ncbi:hypothetical protein KP509_39G010500 [Ceratopteris richardii]|uniref:SAP domain-containing protein n=2 Tax=Ceratopteris richardii TaxID=49495 RepID=A0A8T2PYN0_CERRI|nr:hypothetical protein KP509_39G010500 [Ceratopteris richardii]
MAATSSQPFPNFLGKLSQQQDLSSFSRLSLSSNIFVRSRKCRRRRRREAISPRDSSLSTHLLQQDLGFHQHLRVLETSGATVSCESILDKHVESACLDKSFFNSSGVRKRRTFASSGPAAGSSASFDGRDGTATFGSRLEKDWDDRDGEDIYFNAASSIQGVDIEHRSRSVWQPIELERLESCAENDLRFMFLESLMIKAREGDPFGAEEVFSDMLAVGLNPGPRSFHGLVVSYSRSGDAEGALHALKRELNSGHIPLQETFTCVACSFASIGNQEQGEQLLAAMEHYNLSGRVTWLSFVEDLLQAGYLKEATDTFLKGSKGGYKGTDELYDTLVEKNAEIGHHANCINILRFMEYTGRNCKTSHYNALLRIEANLGEADVALERFEDMRYCEEDKKPDTETYNWLFQSQVRCSVGGDRIQQMIDLLGLMVEDYKRVQPNAKTYTILVEGFTKYNIVDEAIRHFRALSKIPGGTRLLHNNGEHGDPLSLYLRLLCLHGKTDDMMEALEIMEKDNQPIPKRAMIVNRKGRTLVTSWIEPLQQEADLGFEIDYIARYVAEGGLTGTRQRWSPSLSGNYFPVNPDNEGFRYAAPLEISFKSECAEARASYTIELIKKLDRDGVSAFGSGATEDDVQIIKEKLRKDMLAESIQQVRKPKAASKMLVSELKEELEAQGLPSDGTRPVLYQRVQKSRRINRARNRPLWLPPEVEVTEEVDDRLEKLLSRLNLKNENNTDYWKKRFLGESTEDEVEYTQNGELIDADSDAEVSIRKRDDGEGEEEVEEETGELEDGGDEEEVEPPVMLASQLMQKEEALETQTDDHYFEFNLEEQLEDLKRFKLFSVDDMFTIADAWGWTWEKDIGVHWPEKWSKEREVTLGMKVMNKVIDLGGIPTIGDCAMLLRAAMRTPWPEAIVNILQQTHKLGYVFGNPIYDEVVTLCMNLDEREAAIAIVTDMEDTGVNVPDEILDKILPEESFSEDEG